MLVDYTQSGFCIVTKGWRSTCFQKILPGLAIYLPQFIDQNKNLVNI